MTTAPRAHVLFSFNLHVERSLLAQKISNILIICFQLFLPNFKPVSDVKNPNVLEFGEGQEERMERLEKSRLSHERKNLILQELGIVHCAVCIVMITPVHCRY